MVTMSRLRLAVAGIVSGVVLEPIGGEAIQSLQYGVSVTDPLTLVIAPVVIPGAAFLASMVPGVIGSRS